MNKKITPLQALYKIANIEMKEQYKADKGGFVYRVVSDECPKELKIIETALKRLESVDRVGEMFCVNVDKKLKALEIIKEFATFENSTIIIHIPDHKITENGTMFDEENMNKFNFLKEILK